jgi:hypothetical protein
VRLVRCAPTRAAAGSSSASLETQFDDALSSHAAQRTERVIDVVSNRSTGLGILRSERVIRFGWRELQGVGGPGVEETARKSTPLARVIRNDSGPIEDEQVKAPERVLAKDRAASRLRARASAESGFAPTR